MSTIKQPQSPQTPEIWSSDKLRMDAEMSRQAFSTRRTQAGLVGLTKEANESAINVALCALERVMGSGFDPEICRQALVEIFEKNKNLDALRFLAWRPISMDDLKTLSSVVKLSKVTFKPKGPNVTDEVLKAIALDAKKVFETICRNHACDQYRFRDLLIAHNDSLTDVDRTIAAKNWQDRGREDTVRQTAILMANQQAQTYDRNQEKHEVEGDVERLLDRNGFVPVKRKDMPTVANLHDHLKPGQYMKGVVVGSDNMDFVVCLHDRRYLLIECKATNSEINSRKRLKELREVMDNCCKAMGTSIVCMSVIRGVIDLKDLILTQEKNVYLTWHHRMDDLARFIECAR